MNYSSYLCVPNLVRATYTLEHNSTHICITLQKNNLSKLYIFIIEIIGTLMDPAICKNIRSRSHPDQRCSNPAIVGEYCGVHSKHPKPFIPKNEKKTIITNEFISIPINSIKQTLKIQKWWRIFAPTKQRRRQGLARFIPEFCNNQTDFYSMEDISGIPKYCLFSFIDEDNMLYAFDVRSLSSLIESVNGEVLNPYNRRQLTESILFKAKTFISWCRRKRIDTKWTPIEPSTPDQRFQIRVTDIFQKLDQLNYYTNPEWFLKMNIDDHKCFYVELHDIWFHRAGLAPEMRDIIIPPPARPFRYTVRDIVSQKSLENLRKINLDLINMFVSAAVDKSDRSLGAMYVVTALTLVNDQCAESYSWLYESAVPGIYQRYRILTTPTETLQLLSNIFADLHIPPFNLNQIITYEPEEGKEIE
jgi:hypothetical protein